MRQLQGCAQREDAIVGRTKFSFDQRNVADIPTATHPTRDGTAKVSTIEATMLDVAADKQRAAGIDNAATVIIELSEQESFDVAALAGLAPTFPAAPGGRVGWLLTRLTGCDDLTPLKEAVQNIVDSPSELDPYSTVGGPIDTDWMLTTNRDVEPDA